MEAVENSIGPALRIPHPSLSALPIDAQLALLYQASESSHERKRRQKEKKLEREAADRSAKAGLGSDSGSDIQTVKMLTVAVLITMPYSRDASDGESGDISFGTAVYPWAFSVARGRVGTRIY